jgi:predicted Zn finger-like uncharacterized protein
MPTVIHCPSCERKLRVPEQLLGKKVKCPSCGTLFKGTAADGPPPEDEAEGPPPPSERSRVRAGSAPARRRESEDDEDFPGRRRRRDDRDEDDDEDFPSRRRRRLRRDGQPHRGPLVLVLGIFSVVNAVATLLVCCVFPFAMFVTAAIAVGLGLPAWILGARDLRQMKQRTMDESGRGATMGGYVCGIIGTISGALMLVLAIVVAIVGIGFLAFLQTQAGKQKQQGPLFQPMPPPGRPGFQAGPPLRLQDYLPRRALRTGIPTRS